MRKVRVGFVAALIATLGLLVPARSEAAGAPVLGYGYVQPYQPPTMTTTTVVQARPDTLEVNGEYFEATLSGLRQHMDALRQSDEQLWSRMDPELSSLEADRTLGWGLVGGGLVAGGAFTVLAVKDPDGLNSGLLVTGIAALTIGILAGMIVQPSQEDVMRFVNHYNGVAASPIVWQGHVAPARPTAPAGALAATHVESRNEEASVSAAPPPTGAAGFTFGSTVESARSICTDAGLAWKETSDGAYVCLGTPQDIGEKAKTRLAFCEDELCGVQLEIRPEADWARSYRSMLGALEGKYGAARRQDHVPLACQTESDACFADGRAERRSDWRFEGGERIRLHAGTPGGEDAAIRIVYRRGKHVAAGL